jgi:hypothetical protein
MSLKWTRLIVVAVLSVTVACATVQQTGRHAVSRHAVIYEDVSLDDVWNAAKATVGELGFTIRQENQAKGFLDAESKHDAYANGQSPLMNIMIHESVGQIRVDCLMAQDPERIDLNRDYLIRFFDELEKRLIRTDR